MTSTADHSSEPTTHGHEHHETDICGCEVPKAALSRRSLLAAATAGAVAIPLVGAGTAAAAYPKKAKPKTPGRGHYLLKGGALISVDPKIGTVPRADVEIKGGKIVKVGRNLAGRGAKVIDASKMIVMPGFVETHYHMWSALGRNFVTDGLEYFPAKTATSLSYRPDDFYNSIRLGLAESLAAGITTVHNWAHNVRGQQYADAELSAHRDSLLRARYSYGHPDGLSAAIPLNFADIDAVRARWFGEDSPLRGLVHLGINVRGPGQNVATFDLAMKAAKERGLPVSLHAGQSARRTLDVTEALEKKGYLGRDFLLCHFLSANQDDRDAVVRTGTPVSLAPHSELRLGTGGTFHDQLMKLVQSGAKVALSFDASSLAPIDMFQSMNVTWNIGIPWTTNDTASLPLLSLSKTIAMGTINGAYALGIDDQVGSITPGKQADVIMIRQDDLNMAPAAFLESAVVRSAISSNVDTVFVDGRMLKRNKQLVADDPATIVAAAARSAHAVRKRAGGVLAPTATTAPAF